MSYDSDTVKANENNDQLILYLHIVNLLLVVITTKESIRESNVRVTGLILHACLSM